MIRIYVTIVLSLIAMTIYGQNTTRSKLKLEQKTVCEHQDTIMNVDYDRYPQVKAVRFSGYEKSQSSTTESVFVTNNTDRDITLINFTVTYTNLRGEQLHQRTESVKCQLPAYQTRTLTFKTWDKQRLWYYKDTQSKHNAYCSPFDVKITLNYVVVEH